jgi:uncharacterized protein (TIGR02594 family)
MRFANQRIGVTEANRQTVKYFQGITNANNTDLTGKDGAELPWCSCFTNWCMTQARMAGTGKSGASTWLTWGTDATRDVARRVTRKAPYGSIVVLSPDSANRDTTGHVSFLLEITATDVLLLGGNQDNIVEAKSYKLTRVRTYRWPSGFAMPPP